MGRGPIFDLVADFSYGVFACIMVGIIAFTIAFETSTHHLMNHLTAKDDEHGTVHRHLLAKLQKELSILGLISFITTIFEDAVAVDARILQVIWQVVCLCSVFKLG